jgi:hypothetical protein
VFSITIELGFVLLQFGCKDFLDQHSGGRLWPPPLVRPH